MIEDLPHWIELLFVLTFILTLVLFYYANGKPNRLLFVIVVLSIIHSVLAYQGFYIDTTITPPRFGLVLFPSLLLVIYGLFPKQQKWFIEQRDVRISTFSHFIRLPIEIVLWGLFLNEMIPELMTFEGRNFDIVMGVTAPIVGFLLIKNRLGKRALLLWNGVGLILILSILFNGLLSAELPFQQFGFDQPNRAVNYFPFVLLPAIIVPIVIWTHISDMLKLKNEI